MFLSRHPVCSLQVKAKELSTLALKSLPTLKNNEEKKKDKCHNARAQAKNSARCSFLTAHGLHSGIIATITLLHVHSHRQRKTWQAYIQLFFPATNLKMARPRYHPVLMSSSPTVDLSKSATAINQSSVLRNTFALKYSSCIVHGPGLNANVNDLKGQGRKTTTGFHCTTEHSLSQVSRSRFLRRFRSHLTRSLS